MESRIKLAGHPVHPMLIVFPLGLLSTAVLFDIIYLVTGVVRWTEVAYYMIGAGVLGGAAAAIPGWMDWAAIPSGTRAKRIGLLHGAGNVIVLGLFVLSWLLRRPDPSAPPTGGIVAGVLAVVIVGHHRMAGWGTGRPAGGRGGRGGPSGCAQLVVGAPGRRGSPRRLAGRDVGRLPRR